MEKCRFVVLNLGAPDFDAASDLLWHLPAETVKWQPIRRGPTLATVCGARPSSSLHPQRLTPGLVTQ